MTAGPTCPACKIAVLPGYTKCPKCHALLPYSKGSRAATSIDPGGTVAEQKANLWVPLAATVLVAGGIIAFFATRGHASATARDAAVDETPMPAAQQEVPTVASPPPPPNQPLVARPPSAPTPTAAAADLEKQLRRLRLWSTVQATGQRVDIRSATCNDPGMAAAIESASPPLRSAGLTKLRCLEESGRVVFERDF